MLIKEIPVSTGVLCRITDISSRAQKWHVSHRCLLHLQDASGSADIPSDTADVYHCRLSHDRSLSRHEAFLYHRCRINSCGQRVNLVR